MPSASPDWESLRKSVRGYVGSRVSSPDLADEICQQTMIRLLERVNRGEEIRSPEAVAITEAQFAGRQYWRDQREHSDALREYGKIRFPSRGRRVSGANGGPMRLPNAPGRGRPRKTSPSRRMPAVVYLPDGSKLVLPGRKAQQTYKSSTRNGEPVAFTFYLIAYSSGLPDVGDSLTFLDQAMDRERWRAAEFEIRQPRRKRR